MKYYTLREAAKATGISKTTIHNALKSGKISYVNKTGSGYEIDPSELFRVFQPIHKDILNKDTLLDRKGQRDTVLDTKTEAENILLREMLQREKENISYFKSQINDLQHDRDQWRQQAQQITLLLEDKTEKKNDNISWFRKLLNI